MNTLIMYDAIPASAIPSNAQVCSGYCDANYAYSWIDMVRRFPELSAQQRVVSIGTRTSTIARIIDVEPGNPATPAEAAQWVVDMVHHGVYRPGIYFGANIAAEVEQAMENTPLKRDQFVLNIADWTFSETAALARLNQGYDACQFSDQGGGGSYDISLINADTYVPPLSPPPPPTKSPVLAAKLLNDWKDGNWSVQGTGSASTVEFNPQEGTNWVAIGVDTHTGAWAKPVPLPHDWKPTA